MLRFSIDMLRVIFIFFTLAQGSTAHAQIDLHAHLNMKPGLGIFLQGSWEGEPQASHWSDRVYTKASAALLARLTSETRPKLIVMSLYGHPYLGYSWNRNGLNFDRKKNVRASVEQEYQELLQFIRAHADAYSLAKNAKEAREILKSGKTVIVLSLEGAWGTLDSPEDLKLWTERGLAIVTPVHMTPDDFGANALMDTVSSFANSTFDFLHSVWQSRGACLKSYCKSVEGLTPLGDQLIDDLIRAQIWVDAAHSNDIEIKTLIDKFKTAGGKTLGQPVALPMIVTHTQLRENYPVERGIDDEALAYIREHDGIIGLIPSEFMLSAAMKSAKYDSVDAASGAKGLDCVSGLEVYRNSVKRTIELLGGKRERVAMGSDINAPLDGLSPSCTSLNSDPTRSSEMDPRRFDLFRRGYYSYGQWNALAEFVSATNSSTKESWLDQSLEHFLSLWEQIRP